MRASLSSDSLKGVPRAAWWQALGFTRELGLGRAAAVLAWPAFALDDTIRWGRKALWITQDAIVVADGLPLGAKRTLALAAGALVGTAVICWAAMASPYLCALIIAGLLWPLAGVLTLKSATPHPRETRAAQRELKALRKQDQRTKTLELASIARNPRGRRASARELMDLCAVELGVAGYAVTCIARTPWHTGYYAAPTVRGHWEPLDGHLSIFRAMGEVPVRKSRERSGLGG